MYLQSTKGLRADDLAQHALIGSNAGDGGSDGGKVAEPAADASAQARPGNLRALIVEDEALIALYIEGILAEMGVDTVGTAMSANEAVNLTDATRPDFVTMDISLRGDVDGVDAAIEIYRRFAIRSVFITAYHDEALRERSVAASPLGWLTKPLRRDRLETIVRHLSPDRRGH